MERMRYSFVWGLIFVFATCSAQRPEGMFLKEGLHKGHKIEQVGVPTGADRSEVHTIIRENNPDMLYLDAHHSPCTEWDVSRLCQAAEELGVGVIMRIDPADMEYYEWWNTHGILGIKLETVKGVLLSYHLASMQPGVDFMDFGSADLGHDLMLQQHPVLKTIEDCHDFVKRSLEGTGVYF